MSAIVEETPKQRRIRRTKKFFLNLLYVAIAYGLVVLGARMLARRVIYQPPDKDDAALPQGATELVIRSADGREVHAFEFARHVPERPDKNDRTDRHGRTIVHFHGNAETASENQALARDFARRGFTVVLVEYPGYGRSREAGLPSEETLYAAAEAVLGQLAARGDDPSKIILWGQSLGTGVAAEMARRGRGARLVLVAPYTSMVDMGRHVMPVLPMDLVMVDRFDTLLKAPGITQPTVVVHGTADDVIPFEQGRRVGQALPRANFVEVPEGRHDNLYKSPGVLGAIAALAGS